MSDIPIPLFLFRRVYPFILVLAAGVPFVGDTTADGEVLRRARRMPCEEDEVYVWVDVPSVAACVNVEEFVVNEVTEEFRQ